MTTLFQSCSGHDVWVHYGGLNNGVETYVLTTNSADPCCVPVCDDFEPFKQAKQQYYDTVVQHQCQQSGLISHERQTAWTEDLELENVYDPSRYGNTSSAYIQDSFSANNTYMQTKNLYEKFGTKKQSKSRGFSRLHIPSERERVPGPGAYTVEDKWQVSGKNNAPSFTFGGSRPADHKDEIPAPGHYSVPDHHSVKFVKAPAYSIGPKLAIQTKTDGPGPAAHAPVTHQADLRQAKAPAYSIAGGGNRGTKYETVGPGPAKYAHSGDAPDKPSAPAFSMKSRYKEATVEDIPGPAAYGTETDVKKHTYAAVMGTAQKPAPKQFGPGPNQYSSDPNVTKKKIGQGFKFGKARKVKSPESCGPGPAKYHTANQENDENAGFTIAGKGAEMVPDSDMPGPGEYMIRAAIEGPSYTITGGSRPPLAPKSEGPGPGKYGDITSGNDGPAATILGRFTEPKIEDLPGPSQYVHIEKRTGPSATITSRVSGKKAEDTPGPAHYVPLEKRDNVPSISLKGGGEREGLVMKTEGPGPGKYGEVNSKPRGPQARIIGRPPERTVELEDRRPLGITHDLDPTKRTGPSFKLGGRYKDPITTSEGPGPGQYAVALTNTGDPLQSASGARIVGRIKEKKKLKSEQLPGPGEYIVDRTNTGKSFQATSAARIVGRPKEKKLVKSEQLPGPGEYIVDITNTGKPLQATSSARIVGRYRERKLLKSEQTPGPGAFDIDPVSKPKHGYKMMPPTRRYRV